MIPTGPEKWQFFFFFFIQESEHSTGFKPQIFRLPVFRNVSLTINSVNHSESNNLKLCNRYAILFEIYGI